MELESCVCNYEMQRNVLRLVCGKDMQVFVGEDVSPSHSSRPKLTNKFQYCYWEFTMKFVRKVSMNYV